MWSSNCGYFGWHSAPKMIYCVLMVFPTPGPWRQKQKESVLPVAQMDETWMKLKKSETWSLNLQSAAPWWGAAMKCFLDTASDSEAGSWYPEMDAFPKWRAFQFWLRSRVTFRYPEPSSYENLWPLLWFKVAQNQSLCAWIWFSRAAVRGTVPGELCVCVCVCVAVSVCACFLFCVWSFRVDKGGRTSESSQEGLGFPGTQWQEVVPPYKWKLS